MACSKTAALRPKRPICGDREILKASGGRVEVKAGTESVEDKKED